MLKKQKNLYQRHRRIRKKIFGTKEKPRLCVFRSNNHIYAQLINDEKGETILSASDFELKKDKSSSGKIGIALKVGKLIAEKALKEKIEKIVFDRRGYKYHGIIKALADGAREGGLKF